MTTARERLAELLDALPDDQIETVLHFAEALSRGRAVVSVCETAEAEATLLPGQPIASRTEPLTDPDA